MGPRTNRRAWFVAIAALVALFARGARATPPLTPPQRLDAAAVPYPLDGRGDASVVLVLLIDPTGAVLEATVREGASPFSGAALAAVREWHFAPALRDETPVAARILATVTFHAPYASPRARRPPPAQPSPPWAPPPLRTQIEPVAEVSVRCERERPGSHPIPRTETRLL